MALILWFFPDRNEPGTVVGLIVLGLTLVYPVLSLRYFRSAASGLVRVIRRALAVCGIAAVLVGFGVIAWPHGIGRLTEDQKTRFREAIKAQSEPMAVHFMCPPGDEIDCTSATQFIDLFRQAGWRVKGNVVDRVFAGQPRNGLYFVLHSSVDPDPSNPEGKTGAWTKIPRAYFTVKEAFDALTKTELVVGASYPDEELGIYFGARTAKH